MAMQHATATTQQIEAGTSVMDEPERLAALFALQQLQLEAAAVRLEIAAARVELAALCADLAHAD